MSEYRQPDQDHEHKTEQPVVTKTLAGIVAADAQIDQAIKAKVAESKLSRAEVKALQVQRHQAAETLFKVVSRIIPDRLKSSLYSVLAKSNSLESAYLDALNPDSQASELSDTAHMYAYDLKRKLVEYNRDESPTKFQEIQHTFSLLLKAAAKLRDPGEISRLVETLVHYGDNVGEPASNAQILKNGINQLLLEKVLPLLPTDNQVSVIVDALYESDFDLSAHLKTLPADALIKITTELLSTRHESPWTRVAMYESLLELLTLEEKQPVLVLIFSSWMSAELAQTEEIAQTYRKYLDLCDEKIRLQFLDSLMGQDYSFLNYSSGELQQKQIITLTDDLAKRYQLFWRVVRSHADITLIPELDINELVAAAPYSYNSERIISQWLEAGKVDKTVAAAYGQKEIDYLHQQGGIGIYQLIHAAEKYGLDVKQFQTAYEDAFRKAVEAGDISRQLIDIGKKFDVVRIESDWQDFDLDIEATRDYGERTWRKEQSVIDILQNHLDAQDYQYATALARSLVNVKEIDGLQREFYPQDLSRLWNFVHRWPFEATDSNKFSLLPFEYHDKPAELATQLNLGEAIPHTPPNVEVLLIGQEGGEEWVALDELKQTSPDRQIEGVRFTDHGLGYDKGLNAMFAPTKQGLDFLRGRFGQGAKMSMIALLRDNCEIQVQSTAIVARTGQVMQWQGEPAFSDQSETVHFKGKQRQIFGDPTSQETGSVTTIKFGQANPDIKSIFQNMLDPRNGREGLGRYVLEFSPALESYVYGGLDTQSSVAVDSALSGRVYVQGLEVPAKGFQRLQFSYNFSSGAVLTGRDRTYLEAEAVKKDIARVWSGMTDKNAVSALLSLIIRLDDEIPPTRRLDSDSFETNELLSKMDISDESRIVYLEVLKTLLKITEDQSLTYVLVGADQLTSKPRALEQLENAGYVPIVYRSSDAERFLSNVLRSEDVIAFNKAWKETQGVKDSEDEMPISENLRLELQEIMNDSQRFMVTLLAKHELVAEAHALVDKTFTMQFFYSGENQNKYAFFVGHEMVRVNKNGETSMQVVGYNFKLFLQTLFNTKSVPDTLTAGQRTQIRFIFDSQLLNISRLSLAHRAPGYGDDYKFGQDVANHFLNVSGAESAARPVAQKINFSEAIANFEQLKIGLEQQSSAENDPEIIVVRELMLKLEAETEVETIRKIITELNEKALQSQVISKWIDNTFSRRKLGERIFRHADDFWRLGFNADESLGLLSVRPEKIAQLNEYPVYKLHIRNNRCLAIPFDFNRSEVAVIRFKGQEHAISRYKKQPNYPRRYDSNANSDPLTLIDEIKDGQSFFESDVYVQDDLLIFPIDSTNENTLEARSKYLTDEGNLSFYMPGTSEVTEDKRGEPYIETTATTDYGQGKVWDDPVRIFGDIIQNHVDAGKTTIKFRVAGHDDLITEADLMTDEFQNAQIIGLAFEDDGLGYTTQGLRRWGETAKKSGGKKGRFGEGLKMLAISCARNNIGLHCESRDWSAKINSKRKQIVTNGSLRDVRLVGFDMQWNDEPRTGSLTELTSTTNEESTNNLWNQWLTVLDPRLPADENGHRGLSKYVRELRPKTDGEIKVGPITFLVDEPGKIYERGLIVPQAAERMDLKLMFGLDIDQDVIATQERNVVDKEKVIALVREAFAHAPYDVYRQVMREAKRIASLNAKREVANSSDDTATSISQGSSENIPIPLELSLLAEVAGPQILRSLYYEVFGMQAVLSSASNARRQLEAGATYSLSGQRVPLTEEQIFLLNSVIRYESNDVAAGQVVNFGSKLTSLQEGLEPYVRSTRQIVESFNQNPLILNSEEAATIQATLRSVAAEMLTNFEKISQSEEGSAILEYLFAAEGRTPTGFKKLHLSGTELDYALKFLRSVAEGVITLDLKVLANMIGANAYVNGPKNIAYTSGLLSDPDNTIGTTMHEMLHLAFQTGDYNQTFLGLLLLCNPDFAHRYSATG